MEKVTIVRLFDESRDINKEVFGDEENDNQITHQKTRTAGALVFDFLPARAGAMVIIKQRLTLSTWIETKSTNAARFLHDATRDERLCNFDFSEVAANPKSDMYTVLVAKGARNIYNNQLVGAAAEECCWDILWWLIKKQWAKCGRLIARAHPEWWEWQCHVIPELKKKKV